MQLRAKGRIAGIVVIVAIALVIAVAAAGIAYVRVGGPLSRQVQQMNAFTADISPPSQYIVQPMLEAVRLAHDPASLPRRRDRLAALERTFDERAAYWDRADIPASLRSQLEDQAVEKARRFWVIVDRELIPAAEARDEAGLHRAVAALEIAFAEHRAAIDRLVALTGGEVEAVHDHADHAMAVVLGLLGVLALALLGLVWAGTRALRDQALDPLARTAQTMSRMASGDLEAGRCTVHRPDELGEMSRAIEVFREAALNQRADAELQRAVVATLSAALRQLAAGNLADRIGDALDGEYEALRETWNETLELLGELIGSVASTAQSVSVGGQQIRAASDDLARRNEEQASSVAQTASALDDVTRIVHQTADAARDVQQSIAGTHGEAEEGGRVVSAAIEAMAQIERSAGEITSIIDVIDSIAFQTNLLALNAGVEAARAGEAGKGFAVVATEVRALAQRSAEAANDIKALISESARQVGAGVRLVGETGTRLHAILGGVGSVNARLAQMAGAADRQAQNLARINQAVADIDRMTQQNAAMVEQSTAAARSLADQSQGLTTLVARFRTGAAPASAANTGTTLPRPVALPVARAVPAPAHGSGNLALRADPGDWDEF